jgi:hypothetical protein
MGRLWSDPRRRDRIYAELYALLVTSQIIVLQAQDDAVGTEPGFGVIQTSTEIRHDSLEGLDADMVAIREDIRRLAGAQEGSNHYEVLGLDTTATVEDVADAFRERFSKYHTDRFLGMDLGSDLEVLQRVLARWGEARDLLTDDDQRTEYNLAMDRLASGASADVDALLAADGLIRRAERALETGHYKQAHALMLQVLELRPNAEQYQFLEAFAAGMQGLTEAQGTYDKLAGLAAKVTVPGSERMLGQIALRNEARDVARRHFKAAVSQRRDDHVAQRELRRLEA